MAKREAGRRNNSEGGIRQRPDGRWEATISMPDGKRRYFYGRTKADALKRLQDAQAEIRAGRPLPPERLTVETWLTTWLRDTVATTTRPQTADRYREICERHIIPRIGHVKLARLTPADVEGMLRAGMDAGQSPRSVHHWRAVLRTALAGAERHGLIGRNVAALASPPRVPEYEPAEVTPERAREVLSAVRGGKLEALYVLLLGSGLRLGEALALTWRGVDFAAGTISVRHNLARVDGGFVIGETKTKQSRRTVPLLPPVAAALEDHRERQRLERMMAGTAWQGEKWGGLVFTNEKGGPLAGEYAYQHFTRILERVGIPHVRLHDLRHGAASMLAAMGVPPRDVMRLLGHSNIQTTLGVYTASTEGVRNEAMERYGRLIWGDATA